MGCFKKKIFQMLEICGKEVLRERAMSGRELAGQELIDFIRNLVVNVGKIREARLRCRQLEPELETLRTVKKIIMNFTSWARFLENFNKKQNFNFLII